MPIPSFPWPSPQTGPFPRHQASTTRWDGWLKNKAYTGCFLLGFLVLFLMPLCVYWFLIFGVLPFEQAANAQVLL